MTKICTLCLQEKPLVGFDKDSRGKNGRRSQCKECRVLYNQKHRQERIEHYHAYEASRREQRRIYDAQPHHVERRREYVKTERGREVMRAANRRFRERNPKITKATQSVNNAIAAGKLAKSEACWHCGSTESIEGHHPDYDAPLDVVWLCKGCHGRLHTEHVNPIVIARG